MYMVKWVPGGAVNAAVSCGREDTFLHQTFTEFDAVIVVDVQQGDSNTADGRAADQVCTLPAEMRCPFVATRVEQRRELPCHRVHAADVGTLEGIAIKTA